MQNGTTIDPFTRTFSQREAASQRPTALVFPLSCLFAFLVLVLPLFVCLPLDVDTIHYDVCARSLLLGGVEYRDVFQNGLPGMVWLQAAVRWIAGWRSETLRVVDFLIISAVIGLLVRWFLPSDRSFGVRLWISLALIGFYFSRSEWDHCQRDSWMLLPALIGLALRCGQTARLAAAEKKGSGPFPQRSRPLFRPGSIACRGAIEGLCWGVGVWIKPYVIVPAIVCWIVSAVIVLRSNRKASRFLAADFLGLITGGLLCGGAGVCRLWTDGALPYLTEVAFEWFPDYRNCALYAFRAFFVELFPWIVVHILAVPVACLFVFRASFPNSVWERGKNSIQPGGNGLQRPLLGAIYLGWLLQVLTLQKWHEYVHVPCILLAVAVLAAWDWRANRWVVLSLIATLFVTLTLISFPVLTSLERALPLFAALYCRSKQLNRLSAMAGQSSRLSKTGRTPVPPTATIILWGTGEGLLWAVGFWCNPTTAAGGLLCWLILAFMLMIRRRVSPIAGLAVLDLTGLAVGLGLAAVVIYAAAVLLQVDFTDLLLAWRSQAYTQAAPVRMPHLSFFDDLRDLYPQFFVPALVSVIAIVIFVQSQRVENGASATSHRAVSRLPGLLTITYLGSCIPAAFVLDSREILYGPTLFLGVTLIAWWMWQAWHRSTRYVIVAVFIALAVLGHPLLQPHRLVLWGRCIREGSTPEIRDRLSWLERTDWEPLERVADYLRSRDVGNRELTCYSHETPALFLMLDRDPSTRYVFLDLTLQCFAGHNRQIYDELAASPERFVVTHVPSAPENRERHRREEASLPRAFADPGKGYYPWSEPVVFRAGRYLVHEVKHPCRYDVGR